MPDNILQFQQTKMTVEEHRRCREYYFGECGPDQTFYPKRHRWGSWQFGVLRNGRRYKERICQNCSLASDAIYLKETPDAPR